MVVVDLCFCYCFCGVGWFEYCCVFLVGGLDFGLVYLCLFGLVVVVVGLDVVVYCGYCCVDVVFLVWCWWFWYFVGDGCVGYSDVV